MVLQLHLLRHAETTAPPGALIGTTDVALSVKGQAQARQLAELLPVGIPCLCSPLLRTRQTLEHLQAYGVSREVAFDERLREIDFGDYEMKTFADIVTAGGDIDAWMDYAHFTFPGGESVTCFVERLQELLGEWRKIKEGQLIVLTHGGVIRTLICLALGLDINNYLLFTIQHASLSTLELYSQGGVLTALNK